MKNAFFYDKIVVSEKLELGRCNYELTIFI